jgi:hypothetical protein
MTPAYLAGVAVGGAVLDAAASSGHLPDRRRIEPWKISVKGARRASRVARRRRALDGDLARFNAGSPGGWQPLRGARLRRPRGDLQLRGPGSGDLERADVAVARRAQERREAPTACPSPRVNRGPLRAGNCAALELARLRTSQI